jgi:hypothetical protein
VLKARQLLQGFFSKRSGCVFKWVKKGSPAAAPWHILLREGDAAWQVRSMIIGVWYLPVCLLSPARLERAVWQVLLLNDAGAPNAGAPSSSTAYDKLSAAATEPS